MDIFTKRFEEFIDSVTTAYKSIQKIKNTETGCLGLRVSHVMYLYYLGNHPNGLTPTELAKLCHEDKAAVSRTLSDLSGRGYIKTDEKSIGKYKLRFFLTDDGKRRSMSIEQIVQDVSKRVSSGFTDEERAVFYKIFGIINENLEAICEG